MPLPPAQPTDPYAQSLPFYAKNPTANGADGSFALQPIPSASGLGTRQSTIQNERPAVFNRKLLHWLVPEGPMIQMYINPQKIQIAFSKNIPQTRTKGGFLIQYYGENLIDISIDGTTGTSGIEGINVLYDIYRNEQLAFDPYALHLAAKNKQDSMAGDIFGIGSSISSLGTATFNDVEGIFTGANSNLGSGGGVLDSLFGLTEETTALAVKNPPSLASLAATVEMYWSGEVYRGFFTTFTVSESADNIGLFDYSIKFMATQKRGLRRNFFAWHRSATSGPSNSDPYFGTPHSFRSLVQDIPSNNS